MKTQYNHYFSNLTMAIPIKSKIHYYILLNIQLNYYNLVLKVVI
jgi:hypothetical protein